MHMRHGRSVAGIHRLTYPLNRQEREKANHGIPRVDPFRVLSEAEFRLLDFRHFSGLGKLVVPVNCAVCGEGNEGDGNENEKDATFITCPPREANISCNFAFSSTYIQFCPTGIAYGSPATPIVPSACPESRRIRAHRPACIPPPAHRRLARGRICPR